MTAIEALAKFYAETQSFADKQFARVTSYEYSNDKSFAALIDFGSAMLADNDDN